MATATPPQSSPRVRRRRRATTPTWTRDPVLLIAAGVGLLVSAYLAVLDLTGGSAVCLAGSECDAVRTSAYGRVLGVPLTVAGVGFFLTVLIGGLLKVAWQRRLLHVLGGMGVAAALTFLGVQAFVLNAWCSWCLVADAAALTVGLRAFWPGAVGAGRTLLPGAAGATMALAVLVLGYVGAPAAAGSTPTINIARPGSAELVALATHLRESGAVFYGAFWCSHCKAQKEMFGAAAAQLPYVECDARGTNPQTAACQAAGVRAYPTWVINGRKIEGEVSPTDLARLSGFEGQ